MSLVYDKFFKGTDTPVVYQFSFTGDFASGGLNNFTDIVFRIGSEEYDLASGKVVISSDTELLINIGDTTSVNVGAYYPTIIGYNATYDDGYVLAHKCLDATKIVTVCDLS